jgi:hypothetical protein
MVIEESARSLIDRLPQAVSSNDPKTDAPSGQTGAS